jgi:predicted nuclease of predicted toxin-antitoxin system
MPLGVKLDEDLSPLVAEPLTNGGYAMATVFNQGWGGLNDAEPWARVCAESLLFVTADKGFGDIRRYAPGTHTGILVLRPERESITEYQTLVAAVLAKHNLESLAATVTVTSPRSIRVRRAARLS